MMEVAYLVQLYYPYLSKAHNPPNYLHQNYHSAIAAPQPCQPQPATRASKVVFSLFCFALKGAAPSARYAPARHSPVIVLLLIT